MKRNPQPQPQTVHWKRHVLDSIRGILFGFALIAASVGLLWWSETGPLRALESLDETAAQTRAVPADAELAPFDGCVVRLSGRTVADGPVVDDRFGLTADALRLRRRIEVFQWRERIEHVEADRAGRNADVQLALYTREWSDTLIDSSDFQKADSHVNPTRKPIDDAQRDAVNVLVHGARLSPQFVRQLTRFEPVPLTGERFGALPEGVRSRFRAHDGMLYSSAYPVAPQIGDVRIGFEAVPASDVTVVGRLSGRTLSAYDAKAGRPVALIATGQHNAADLFDRAIDAAPAPSWLTRGVALGAIGLGAALVLCPFAHVRDRLPRLGRPLRFGYALPAAVVALGIASATLALRWFTYRPVFAVLALALVAAATGWLYTFTDLDQPPQRDPAQPADCL